jgi:hypothetical protein
MLTDRTVKPLKKKPLLFIFHDATDSNAGTNKAAINSHIAKTAHDRRRQAKISQQCSCVAYDCPHVRIDHKKEVAKQTPSPVTLLVKSFDPFNPIPGVTSREDKSLLHLYLVDMPSAIYGTHQNAAFCPIRDGSYQFCYTDKITLQWVLLYAETYITMQNPGRDQSSIFKRKTYAYNMMGKMLADPAKRQHINATAGLGAAAIAEVRWGDFAKAKLHFDAVKFIIHNAGGPYAVQAMPLNQGVILLVVYLALVVLETPVFPNYLVFEDAKSRFVDTLRAIQSWHQTLCFPTKKQWHKRFFSPSSALRRFINPRSPLPDPVSMASHFVILYNLNFTLFDLRHSPTEADAFLRDLAHDVRAGSIPSSSGQCTLKPMTAVLILANRASLAGEKKGLVGGLWRSWKVIDVMRLMRLVEVNVMERLLEAMSSWLTGEVVGELDEEGFKEMENSMEINWLRTS